MIDTNIILHFLIIQEINESDFDNIFAQIIFPVLASIYKIAEVQGSSSEYDNTFQTVYFLLVSSFGFSLSSMFKKLFS